MTTLVVKYNSSYIYIIPLCILPIILKVFLMPAWVFFVHVLTILLLGFIVPNSFEFMFLQIIAGIVTILTVSELYKRANLFISVGQITFDLHRGLFCFFHHTRRQFAANRPQKLFVLHCMWIVTLFAFPFDLCL